MTTRTYGSTVTVEDLETDPYPIYKRLRDEEPVSWVESVGLWLVTRWDDVKHVDLHLQIFTGETEPSTLNRTFGKNLLGSEGPYHDRIRGIIQPAFKPSAVRAYTERAITPIANELLDELAERGSMDLVSEFSEKMSVRTLRVLLGLEELPDERLQRWFEELATGASNFEGDPEKQAIADRASREVNETIEPILDRLEREPDETLLSHMLHSEVDGQRLSRQEILSNLKVMIVGGMQEPGDLIAITTWALLTHPEQAERVKADHSLIRQTVEETLRWYSPVGTSTRQVTEPATIAGVELEEGALVAAVVSSANRDERHWTDPDRFNIDRRQGPHLAFAIGSHFCAGAPLARTEANIALEALLSRLPNMRLMADQEVVIRGWEFRRPLALHVEWDR